MTTSVKAKFRPSRVKGKTGSVYFQVIHDRMARQISTGYKLFPEEWKDGEVALPEQNPERSRYLAEIAQNLQNMRKRIEAIIHRLDESGKLYTADEVVAALGLIPRTHYFDGSDGEEIYPSLEGATVGDVRAAKQELQDTTYVPSQTVYPDASERVDEIEAAANPEDDGYSGGSDGSKYKDTQVVSYAGVNRQQVHVSSNVRPEQYGDPTEVSYYIFSQVPLSKDEAVTVESGMEGYIEDANGIIYSDAGSVKVVLTLIRRANLTEKSWLFVRAL